SETEDVTAFKRIRVVSRSKAKKPTERLPDLLFLDAPAHSQEEYQEMERSAQMQLAETQVALGLDHAETISSMNELAWLSRCQRRFSEAENLLRSAVAASERS